MTQISATKLRENWNKYFDKDTGLIIDLGCGYGVDAYFLAQRGYKVIAIDEEKNIKFQHPNLEFIRQKLNTLIDGEFDGVIANFSFQFLTPMDRLEIMNHYLKGLKPGGILYILIFKKFVTPAFLNLFPEKPTIEYFLKEDYHQPEGGHVHEIAKIIYKKPLKIKILTMEQSKIDIIPKSFRLQWHITERCNFRCLHCYQENYDTQEMNLGQMEKVLIEFVDLIKKWDIPPYRASLIIAGGEPFLYKDFSLFWLKFVNIRRIIIGPFCPMAP